jgi:hypothetical protein
MGGAGPCSPPLDPPLLLDTSLLSAVVWNGCTRDPAECHGESPWRCSAQGGLAGSRLPWRIIVAGQATQLHRQGIEAMGKASVMRFGFY